MENKYYTPIIEEFHVGFEHESYNGKVWSKEISKTCYSDQAYICLPIPEKDYGYDYENTRVKYLDREDLESIGWNVKVYYKGSGYFNFKNYNFGFHNSTDEKSSLFMWCTISQNDFGNNIMIFQGTIKNKSELKKLMQMLNIK